MNFHPASELFPLMRAAELAALADDIAAHGLDDPITLLDGAVLDGRNRLRACEIAGVEPQFVEWSQNGSTPIEWVVSHNLKRRHLTIAQRAAIAFDLLPQLEAEAKERQRLSQGPGKKGSPIADDLSGRSDAKAAEMVGVGRTAVATAKAVAKRNPAVLDAMRSGDLTVAEARRKVGLTVGAHAPITDGAPRVAFGKGDKWREASEPLARYLARFKKRGYDFPHVAPNEARKRLATIERLIAELMEARSGLEPRSHNYRLTAGREP